MAGREYQGAGGLRLHLDEPLSDEMAKQVARGHLVLVDGEAPEAEEPSTSTESDGDAKRPNANSPVADWRAYAVSLGMPEEEAAAATKKECQEYVQVVEDAHGDSQVTE